jgi:hypothetical protein
MAGAGATVAGLEAPVPRSLMRHGMVDALRGTLGVIDGNFKVFCSHCSCTDVREADPELHVSGHALCMSFVCKMVLNDGGSTFKTAQLVAGRLNLRRHGLLHSTLWAR